jgi:hypothetical protein
MTYALPYRLGHDLVPALLCRSNAFSIGVWLLWLAVLAIVLLRGGRRGTVGSSVADES